MVKRPWHEFFYSTDIVVMINSGVYVLEGVSEKVILFSEKASNFQVKIYVGKHLVCEKNIDELGSNVIEFESQNTRGRLYFVLVDSGWAYLLGNKTVYNKCTIISSIEKEEDIDDEENSSINNDRIVDNYCDRKYYVNSKTLESGFTRKFKSENYNFSSFEKIRHEGHEYYVNFDCRLVLTICPESRLELAKERFGKIRRLIYDAETIGNNYAVIDRTNLLEFGAKALLGDIERLRQMRSVFTFKDEIGEDYGGIRREFFYLVTKELFKDQRLEEVDGIYDVREYNKCEECLYDFSCESDVAKDIYIQAKERDGQIVDTNGRIIDDSVFYTFLGVLVGFALRYEERVGETLSLAFYENLCGQNFSLRHIQDPEYQKNILKAGAEGFEECGQIEDVIREKLFERKKNAYDFIRIGFRAVVPIDLEGLGALDLLFLLHEFEDISVRSLQAYAEYDNCGRSTKEIVWLWDILECKDDAFLRRFLQFCTGSGNYQGVERKRKFWIEQCMTGEMFIRASSCAYRVYIGCYETKEQMEYYLDYSILNTEGFHKV